MVISLLMFLLLSNAVTSRQDKSILYSRIVIIGLIFSSYLVENYIHIMCIYIILLPLLASITSGFFTRKVSGFLKDFIILVKYLKQTFPLALLLLAMMSVCFTSYTYIVPSYWPILALFYSCIVGILTIITLLAFNYVTNPGTRNFLIWLTVALFILFVFIVACFSFTLVKHLWEYVLKMNESPNPGDSSGKASGSQNGGPSNGGPSNNGGNNNNQGHSALGHDDSRRQSDKDRLKTRIESYVGMAEAARVAAGKSPQPVTYGDIWDVSKQSLRPMTWPEQNLLQELIRDAGGDSQRYGMYTVASTRHNARYTIYKLFG